MNFTEFVGFIITLLAFFLLMVKQARDERKRRQNPELYVEEEAKQQEAVRELLKSLNIDVEDETPLPKEMELPPALPKENKTEDIPESRRLVELNSRAIRGRFEHGDAYGIQKERQSSAKMILKKIGSLKDAVVLKEILGPPKGLE